MSMERNRARLLVVAMSIAVAVAGCAGSDSGFREGLQAYDSARYQEAIALWADAAENGNADAEQALGWAYSNGLGVERNYAEAMTWYGRAAKQGHAGAQVNLAILHDDGLGVPAPDPRRAAELFGEAAEAGSPEAQNALGRMYKAGRGVPRDLQKATIWLERAAHRAMRRRRTASA